MTGPFSTHFSAAGSPDCLALSFHTFNLANIYLPPSGSQDKQGTEDPLIHYHASLQLLSTAGKPFLIAADTNALLGNLQTYSGPPRSSQDCHPVSTRGRTLVDLNDRHGVYTLHGTNLDLSQGKTTSYHSSRANFTAIDHIFASATQLTCTLSFNVLPLLEDSNSLHAPVSCSFLSTAQLITSQRFVKRLKPIEHREPGKPDYWMYKVIQAAAKANHVSYEESMAQRYQPIVSFLKRQTRANFFMPDFLPHDLPTWVSAASLSPYDARRSLQRLQRSIRRVDRRNQVSNAIHSASRNPGSFFRGLRSLKATPSSESVETAEDTANYFSSLFDASKNKTRSHEAGPSFIGPERPPHALWEAPITLDEVTSVLKRLSIRNSSPGHDHIRYRELLGLEHELHQLLLYCQEHATLPIEMLITRFLLIRKKTSISGKPSTFRGIALGTTIRKLLTTIIADRAQLWALEIGLLTENQFGFVGGRSHVDALFVLRAILEHTHKHRKALLITFYDIEKAFDNVQRDLLFSHLHRLGAVGSLATLLQLVYEHDSGYVEADGCRAFFTSSQGVLQGDPPSPILWAIYLALFNFPLSRNGCDPIIGGLAISHSSVADDLATFSIAPAAVSRNPRLAASAMHMDSQCKVSTGSLAYVPRSLFCPSTITLPVSAAPLGCRSLLPRQQLCWFTQVASPSRRTGLLSSMNKDIFARLPKSGTLVSLCKLCDLSPSRRTSSTGDSWLLAVLRRSLATNSGSDSSELLTFCNTSPWSSFPSSLPMHRSPLIRAVRKQIGSKLAACAGSSELARAVQ